MLSVRQLVSEMNKNDWYYKMWRGCDLSWFPPHLKSHTTYFPWYIGSVTFYMCTIRYNYGLSFLKPLLIIAWFLVWSGWLNKAHLLCLWWKLWRAEGLISSFFCFFLVKILINSCWWDSNATYKNVATHKRNPSWDLQTIDLVSETSFYSGLIYICLFEIKRYSCSWGFHFLIKCYKWQRWLPCTTFSTQVGQTQPTKKTSGHCIKKKWCVMYGSTQAGYRS